MNTNLMGDAGGHDDFQQTHSWRRADSSILRERGPTARRLAVCLWIKYAHLALIRTVMRQRRVDFPAIERIAPDQRPISLTHLPAAKLFAQASECRLSFRDE